MMSSSNSSEAVVQGVPLHRSAHRWKVLATGVLANASFTCVIGGVPAASILLRDHYDTTTAIIGLIMGMTGLGIAVSEIPWGIMTDKVGDRPILIVGLLGTALALLMLAVTASSGQLGFLFLGLLLVGLLGSGVNGSSGRAIMSWFAPEERGFAMSIRQTAVPMGYGLGAVLFPWLTVHVGLLSGFAVLGAACCVAALFAWIWIVDPEYKPSPPHHGRGSALSGPGGHRALRSLAIWRIVLAIGLLCAPQFAIMTFSTIFLHDVVHAEVATTSGILFCIQMSSMFTRIGSGRWTDRKRNRRPFLKGSTALTVAAFAGLAIVTLFIGEAGEGGVRTGAVIAAVLVAGVVVSAWHGVAYTELATEAGPASVGTALAMGNTVVFLVLFVTPALIPSLLAVASWPVIWALMALLSAVAFLLFPSDKRRPAD